MVTGGLVAKNITKGYSGVPVLMGVSLSVDPGEIVGLVGHNGAGKSTLLKVFSGAHQPSGGTLEIDGQEVSFSSPSDAIAEGVSTVYQELSLLQNLTVTQNVFLGREESGAFGLNKKQMSFEAREITLNFDLDVDVDRTVGNYSMATRQLLEIAIAASRNTKYLLLDEPTTSLEGEQVDHLLEYVKRLAKEKNIGVLIVNHKLDELYGVADRIVALMNGQVVIDGPTEKVDRRDVVAAIAGEGYQESEVGEKARARQLSKRKKVMELRGLTSAALEDVSFDIRAGEILGIYGLSGSGRTETLRTIAGLDRYDGGTMTVAGERYEPKTPKHAKQRGIAFVTEERKHDGIVPEMNSYQNASLPVVRDYAKFGLLDLRRMKQESKKVLESLQLRGDPAQPIVALSGGNQQKVLLARALIQEPKILLLDEPTKGVDIGVKSEIYEILRKLADEEELAVVVVSSEEEEILEISDTVLVLANGQVVHGPVPANEVTQRDLREWSWTE
uniref:sugar ABC transporter ATP-binding protein n=1 Tax=Tessaracoccus timonensis TaxID=2161816 RepID=UPI000D551036|nr:sugar ABC transporter ATP-binding protein [Tessaracoccus timonensis]